MDTRSSKVDWRITVVKYVKSTFVLLTLLGMALLAGCEVRHPRPGKPVADDPPAAVDTTEGKVPAR